MIKNIKFNHKIMALGLYLELIQNDGVQIFVDKKLARTFPHAEIQQSVITQNCVRLFLKQGEKIRVAEINKDGQVSTFTQD